jgi:hypothetical protein
VIVLSIILNLALYQYTLRVQSLDAPDLIHESSHTHSAIVDNSNIYNDPISSSLISTISLLDKEMMLPLLNN